MTRTWIFQANPDRFDIDGFLATRPGQTSWLVTRLGQKMKIGDEVFIWRAAGAGDAQNAGIIAKAEIISEPTMRADDPKALRFWKSQADASRIAKRVALRLIRVANKKEVLRRSWLVEDPALRDLSILKMSNATNYSVAPDHARRIGNLWDKVDQDWSYAESIAGLWVYAHTYGREVSKLPTSPVARVSLLIGRAVGGVYNKVMNFRSLDPREERKGLSGASGMDEAVWADYFDADSRTIREAALDSEVTRLWGATNSVTPSDEADAIEVSVEKDAQHLLSWSLSDLLAAYDRSHETQSAKPRVRQAATRSYERDPLVVAIAKKRANFRCEVPGCTHPLFIDDDGNNYCEVHHIHPLSKGGVDTPENVASICPSHHREAHLGRNAESLREQLTALRREARDGPHSERKMTAR